MFTAITAWIMVYTMTIYNALLLDNNFTTDVLWHALKEMWFEFVIIFCCAYFLSSKFAKYSAFKFVTPQSKPIVIILTIQTFTVIAQVTFASFIGLYHSNGFTSSFIQNYLLTFFHNFIMALPLQLLIAGPITRKLFRLIFRSADQNAQKATVE
ncbi:MULTISPECIES: DUF2798 domain-containing protein [unclassified Lactococcus]|uniref:DUF2798 domain-containing protein n=1 Tax=unclassified Lactococcus TaxID=2643510 RepID=UPI0011CC899F|nr:MULTISPECIES: DUF2798 domain-containing protein [unclassified Lactococcus]MQW23353.1 DUF2798 domain-containing protein [Lactococcus sp. dk101]TXK37946.1 DUF2798 domain-containing protein [Lactococcus sp. dk310]TXK49600.1 DUF2798 domain-containing protein [Lactococcus sp. dk322]